MLVVVNYILKWPMAIVNPANDSKVVIMFLKKHIFTCFGRPRALLSDNGTHFCKEPLESLIKRYAIFHKIGTLYDPQPSSQIELSNHKLKSILKKTIDRSRKDWALKLDDALWTY